MTTRRLNKSVNALRKYLVEHKVPKADLVAQLLLTEGSSYSPLSDDISFTINIAGNGPFSAVIGQGMSVTQLRKTLITAGMLVSVSSTMGPEQWRLGITDKLKKYRARYEYEVKGIEDPAVALKKEVEKLEKKAAKENLKLRTELQAEIDKLRSENEAQMSALWSAIQHIERNDAPVTAEKIERHLRVV